MLWQACARQTDRQTEEPVLDTGVSCLSVVYLSMMLSSCSLSMPVYTC